MKPVYYLLLSSFFFASSQLYAAVITVSNRTGDIADFSMIADAVTAASDGDIIYVSGSATTYGNFAVDKRLRFIGSGHNPGNGDPLISQFGTVSLLSGSSGSEFIGFSMNQIFVATGLTITDVKLHRNVIRGQSQVAISLGDGSQRWTVTENILLAAIRSNSSNQSFEELHVFANNIIQANVLNVRYSKFYNNVFTAITAVLNDVLYNAFNNNIFYHNNLNLNFSGSTNSIRNCSFNRNIFFGQNNPTSFPQGNNNVGEGNIFANPLFVNVPANAFFNYTQNFGLQTASPGINAGSDNTDIGLFGGTGFSVSGEPSIPQVTIFNIRNSIVPQGGNLNIRIEGKANN